MNYEVGQKLKVTTQAGSHYYGTVTLYHCDDLYIKWSKGHSGIITPDLYIIEVLDIDDIQFRLMYS